MKKALVVIILLLLVAGCNKEEEIAFKTITPEEAKMELEKDSSIILLDVRNKFEYDDGHIPGSIVIPVDDLENTVESKIKDKGTKIFVYCQGGVRSKNASGILVDLGYTNVYDLGGINNWPYEIE